MRDYAEVRGDGSVNGDTARAALALFEVDERGLDKVDRALLHALCVTFAGQPVGLSTLAVAVGEEPDTVEEVYEPFLLKQGLLMRTPRGRVATAAGFGHLDLAAPVAEAPSPGLFDPPSDPDSQGPRATVLRRFLPESLPLMAIIFLYLALLAVAFFVLIVRPQRRQMAARRSLIASLEVGDEVITAGGIYGTVRELTDTTLLVEVAPGVMLTLAREAVSGRPPAPPAIDLADTDDETELTRRPRPTKKPLGHPETAVRTADKIWKARGD